MNYGSLLFDSDLWGNGKLHAQKFVAHWYSREDNPVMLFRLISRQQIYFSYIQTDVNCTKIQLQLSQTVIQLLLKLKTYLGFFHDLPG